MQEDKFSEGEIKKCWQKKNSHFLSELQEICLAPSAMCFYNTSVIAKLLLEMNIWNHKNCGFYKHL